MKLWDKGYTTDNIVENFTLGKDRALDLKLAKYDVQGSIAHSKMLHEIGILTSDELSSICAELKNIEVDIENGDFTIEEGFEDVHSKIEYLLTQKLGDMGKKIHTARSRNDQVLVDLHLYTKNELGEIKALVKNLFDSLMQLSATYKDVLMPGYTHMQVAMPSSFGLWFSAFAECLIDDVHMLNAAYAISDQNPLGSAAGYGSSFPINRTLTTELLGFDTMKYNVVAAQLSRGKLEKTTSFALASVAGTLSKLASDVCLYMSQNFGFFSLPNELTTGSSIMPHKKNPDVFELMRAKCNKIQNLPAEITLITNNLSTGYHRDFQLLKENLIFSIDDMKDNLSVCDFMVNHLIVNKEVLDNPIYDYLYSVEVVNERVMQGKTFRDAYVELGKEINDGTYKPNKVVNHSHEGSIGNLCLDKIQEKFDAAYA